jgi:hypothetical protein
MRHLERQEDSQMKKRLSAALIGLGALAVASGTAAAGPQGPLEPNDSSPRNMGYCARYLGGGGLGVRDDINRLLAKNGELFGYRNPGELYSARARSTDDRQCLPRQTPPAP